MIKESHDLMMHWITEYGSVALFGMLALGIVGLPIPDETILVFTGYMMAKGHLPLTTTFIAAFGGSVFGISLSYLIGVTGGKTVAHRYGKWIGLTEPKLDKVHNWFERIGKWTLVIGYYIPGVRHFTGFCAGTAELEYWKFAIFAYTGALIWSVTFLCVGYYFFGTWQHYHLF